MSEKIRRYFYSLMTDEAQGPAAATLKLLLYVLSFDYASVLAVTRLLLKRGIVRSYRPKCRVISVGNITLGGTGKTPLTMEIARRFREKGKKVVILTRGYMKDRDTGMADEAEVFKSSLDGVPVLVGRDRIASAKEAEEKYAPDIILLDDGFQHLRLKRDVDVVAVSSDNPFGNGKLIPRGILREPVSALKRAHIIVVTKVLPEEASQGRAEILKDRIRDVNPDAAIFNASYEPRRLYDAMGDAEAPIDCLNNKSVALLCAIGDPASFEDSVVSLGANIAAAYFFMDHHIFSSREIGRIAAECKGKGIDTIVTTEKDLPRIKQAGAADPGLGVKMLALAVEIKINDEEHFFGGLDPIFIRKA
ncbi:MAG: tetraacyldisaccharide 4'-kinase [Candidatus Omnitrophica bacterium]|nr:tetraacyldisaccharide 4'-kinase [Candidatus Omnitrophota bacterium]